MRAPRRISTRARPRLPATSFSRSRTTAACWAWLPWGGRAPEADHAAVGLRAGVLPEAAQQPGRAPQEGDGPLRGDAPRLGQHDRQVHNIMPGRATSRSTALNKSAQRPRSRPSGRRPSPWRATRRAPLPPSGWPIRVSEATPFAVTSGHSASAQSSSGHSARVAFIFGEPQGVPVPQHPLCDFMWHAVDVFLAPLLFDGPKRKRVLRCQPRGHPQLVPDALGEPAPEPPPSLAVHLVLGPRRQLPCRGQEAAAGSPRGNATDELRGGIELRDEWEGALRSPSRVRAQARGPATSAANRHPSRGSCRR